MPQLIVNFTKLNFLYTDRQRFSFDLVQLFYCSDYDLDYASRQFYIRLLILATAYILVEAKGSIASLSTRLPK
jgi:hypothetical protein